jgi:hypothetical protein
MRTQGRAEQSGGNFLRKDTPPPSFPHPGVSLAPAGIDFDSIFDAACRRGLSRDM